MKVRRLSLIIGFTLLLALALVATIVPASLRGPAKAEAAPLAQTFHALLRGYKEVGPNTSAATGTAKVVLNDAEDTITVDATFSGLVSNATAGHIHDQEAGVNGPIVFPFSGVPAATSGSIPQQTFAITPAQVVELKAGGLYVNIHSSTFPGGEIRGQLVEETFLASLDGAQEVPPTGSPGTGDGEVGLSGDESKVIVDLAFDGLQSTASAAHIHEGPAGANGPIIITLTGVPAATSGRIPEQPHPITAPQVADLRAGGLYFNVHSDTFPDGEIRGQIAQAPTRVRISGASATRTARGVLVRWRTASEVGTAGFNVYRETVGLTRLNARLIRSKSAGTARGHSYAWLDRGARAGAGRYRIESVGVHGARSWIATAVARR